MRKKNSSSFLQLSHFFCWMEPRHWPFFQFQEILNWIETLPLTLSYLKDSFHVVCPMARWVISKHPFSRWNKKIIQNFNVDLCMTTLQIHYWRLFYPILFIDCPLQTHCKLVFLYFKLFLTVQSQTWTSFLSISLCEFWKCKSCIILSCIASMFYLGLPVRLHLIPFSFLLYFIVFQLTSLVLEPWFISVCPKEWRFHNICQGLYVDACHSHILDKICLIELI